jgi:uncharacterized membrane protein
MKGDELCSDAGLTPSRLPLSTLLAAYAVVLAVMGALDAVWLGWLAIDFYRRELGSLMTDSVRVLPAAVYYLGYPLAVVYLALTPRPSNWRSAALRSAVLGMAAFGVYDLTNLSTLRGYSVAMTVVDMLWGSFATMLGGSAAYAVVISRSKRRRARSRCRHRRPPAMRPACRSPRPPGGRWPCRLR